MLDIASDQWRVGGPAWGPSEQILHAPLQVPVRDARRQSDHAPTRPFETLGELTDK